MWREKRKTDWGRESISFLCGCWLIYETIIWLHLESNAYTLFFVWYELIYSLWHMYAVTFTPIPYLEIKHNNCGTKLNLRITNVNACSPIYRVSSSSKIIISFSGFFEIINRFAIVSMVHHLVKPNIFESLLLYLEKNALKHFVPSMQR